jgi:pimeloyl-ACP methyl ester carboxylesterase
MHIHLCIGFLESRDGPFLGLREFMNTQVLPRFPGTTVAYNSWRDDVAEEVAACAARGNGPLILLGHSYGASALFRAARQLRGKVVVDHFIMLDPVPRWLWGQFQWTSYRLPQNVKAATCLYNPVSLPKSSPIRNVRGNGMYRNVKVTARHAAIPGDAVVQFCIMEIIRATDMWYGPYGSSPNDVVKVPPVGRGL